MKKFYIALSLLLLLVIVWFAGYTYLLGFNTVINSLVRDVILITILYFVIIVLTAIKLYKKNGKKAVDEFFKERKKYQEKYYKNNK
ncbi:hypothetical protein I6H59_03835 [Lactococcus garvieae]|jgi:type VI protein secretion system component VasK|uniref:hypothetical protein n=1 Tax=Lactococcus petauri TaxID=1940789 RepID=UPI00051FD4DF|nr:hypothetical protein I6H59_03835 [Lactococcus garvieae]CEF50992.1 hypothetical protein LGMT14_00853 [Lactococcus garvieae]